MDKNVSTCNLDRRSKEKVATYAWFLHGETMHTCVECSFDLQDSKTHFFQLLKASLGMHVHNTYTLIDMQK